MALFNELGLQEELLKAVLDMGFDSPTPIQEQIIPLAMQGIDLIGQAQTGTGKTAAFGIPLLSKIEKDNKAVQALILAPTRELALQVSQEINRLAKYKNVEAIAIYGGEDIGKQIRGLKNNPQIFVATPGRFMDHMRRNTINLANIQTVILDEADEMLSMGFIEDIETILQEVPSERQTLLFSATMPKRIQAVSQKFMKSPQTVAVKNKTMTVDTIEQRYLDLKEKDKFDALCRLMDIHCPELSIIFGRTKRRVDELSEALSIRGYDVEGIHGDMKQERREKVLRKFKRGSIKILVATDVAARGLDISGVSHVFNFDLPQDPESYVHRIGRTGRAGQKGISFTFVTPREREYLELIEDTTKSKMLKQHVPSIGDAKDARYRQAAQKLIGIAESAKTHDLEEAAQKLLEEYDAVKLVSAALKMVTKQSSDAPVTLTDESPVRMKKKPMKSSGSRYSKDSKPGSGSSSYKGKGKSYSNSSKKYPASKSQGSSKTERAEKSDNYRKRKTSHNHSNKTTI